jgi:hypothetical protein
MLYALRKARTSELWLALAVLLTVSGSLGLHPEPSMAGSPGEHFGWNVSSKPTAGPHDCPICLAHRSLSVSDPFGVVLKPVSSVRALLCLAVSDPQKPPASPHAGRAPPSA